MRPLENIKILDLTRVLAGPFCTMILSDLGAEVIKIEMPGTGDDARSFGPFKNGQSLYFLSINREKKSVSLNLKSAKGKSIFKKLIKKVDVIVENYRPGTMEKLGLGYDVLKEINPALIYAATSGYGHTGPKSTKASYDILAQAMGGIMSITGWPGSPPTRVGMSLGDITASLYAAIGILAALYQRKATGLGQKVDVAMLDCQVSLLENAITRYQVEGKLPEPLGNRHAGITPFQAFRASDGYFVIAAGNDSLWKKLCQAIGREDLIAHEKFATNPLRTQNIEIIEAELQSTLGQKTVDEWVAIIDDAGVPTGPINTIDRVMCDDQIIARNMIVDVEDKRAGTIKIAGNPIKMDSVPEIPTRSAAPEIGEHNQEILKSLLDLSDTEIAQLLNLGVI
ncbi:MAG: CaiB/BaiF CoA-transferase family protein [Bacteroidales bacterium]|nr:CaiB/BaiF CoA-transferase family protein [Bacteroidales bacterium]MDZ4203346.1 CaiB/BaiF CoA-transferase family protein [Bacteroidales bacterium]